MHTINLREPHEHEKMKQLTLEGWFHLSDPHDDHKLPQLCLSYSKDNIYTELYENMDVFPTIIFVKFNDPPFYWVNLSQWNK